VQGLGPGLNLNTLNPKPEPYTLHLKPKILNPKPKTLNPKA